MTSAMAALLDEYGVTSSESEFVCALRTALAAEPRADAATLTAAESDFLAEHSGIDAGAAAKAGDPQRLAVERARVEFELLRRSHTVAELADRLGVDGSRVRHRVRNGALYGLRVGRHLRLPGWQFDRELRPLPGLAAVLAALPEGMHPRDVEGFMTTQQDALRLRGRPTTPREWLLSGGNPAAVAELATDLDRW